MTMRLMVGTGAGMLELTDESATTDPSFGPRTVTALGVRDGRAWAVADGRAIVRREPDGRWSDVARSDAFDLACLAPTSHGVFAGTEEAHLFRLVGDDGTLAPVEAFGTGDGEVFVSDDAGGRWTRAATDLPSIRAVRLV